MSVYQAVWRFIDESVHPDARRSPSERPRHEFFIFSRIATTLFALIFIPPYLVFTGGLSLWETGVLVWVIFPLAAIAHLSRTGRLGEAQLISMFSLVLLSMLISLAPGPSRDITLGWLMLIPLEAAISGSSLMLLMASFLVVTTLLSLMGAQHVGLIGFGTQFSVVAAAALAAPAAVYAGLLALGARRNHEVRRRIEFVNSARYRVLSEVIGDLVLRHDASGGVLSVSSGAEALFGLQAEDLLDRGLVERIHVADRPAFLRTVEAAARQDGTSTATLRLLTGRNEPTGGGLEEPVFAWAEIRMHRFAGGMEELHDRDDAALVSVIRNVTSAKLAEERLKSARAEAELANSWKDRLLANVSHELRTPLNAILGFSEILGDPEIAPREAAKQREYASIIHSSAEHLLSVVNLVLDMSRIEAGKFEILPEPFEIGQLIASCFDMIRLKAEAGGVEMIAVPPAKGTGEIVADKRACRQILLNLMSNAVKFTPSGGTVTVRAEIIGAYCHLTVADTGIGVPEEHLSRLGEPFYQVRASYDRAFEGAGLGLSLVRGLVGLQGGALLLESVAGQGTRVTVKLPIERSRRSLTGSAISTRVETAPYFRESANAGKPDLRNIRPESAAPPERKIA